MGYDIQDLEPDEVRWLRRLNAGETEEMPSAMAVRLTELGLARATLEGIVITEDGVRLLESAEE